MAADGQVKSAKAVGTRDRVVTWLAANGEVQDQSGMASTALARAIGYPGSSIAFAQLLSGMERSGLIAREVRGKRTYRVWLTDGGRHRASTSAPSGAGRRQLPGGQGTRQRLGAQVSEHGAHERAPAPAGTGPRGSGGDLVDYDELARRLLVQVARRLATEPSGVRSPEAPASLSSQDAAAPGVEVLEQRLQVLELELSRARAARLALQEENEELRDQLERIRSSLDGGAGRRPRKQVAPARADEIDHSQIALLQRMLSDRQGGSPREPGKATTA